MTQARQIAFEILRRVEAQDAYAADLLHARLRGPVKPEDAALVTELTLGVLRWRRLLDFLLERHLAQPVEKLDLEVRVALRLGLYQLRYLSRVPARAAVNESVELVKWANKRSAARLVNAVLRRAAEAARQPAEQFLPLALPRAEYLGILYSHPTWMVERWLRFFGEERTLALLEAHNRPRRVTCMIQNQEELAPVVEALKKAGLRVEPGKLLRSAIGVSGGDAAKTEPFRRGQISFQSEASHLAALLVDVPSGSRVLDLCAAPGGKTAVLARAAGPSGVVIAADKHLHRLRAMGLQMTRVSATNVHRLALDAARPLPFSKGFVRILVDAPCSGTGTLASNPETRWRLRKEDLADFHARQVKFLSHALDCLAPGGRLVYSTCSLEPEENEHVVAAALGARRDIRCLSPASALCGHLNEGIRPETLTGQDGFLRTFPPEQGTDGFFAAVLERTLKLNGSPGAC
ncbi:MAG TPA: 16S rRNA (cytosine(967)-C(5))-methyltransferase RsmB [Candidatus Acidoferrales bacterium]|nr:16S rRNA (cytosine(967)-C(5))-methyltransferase RsmB [Candidatus Acidoferrales bacterium]